MKFSILALTVGVLVQSSGQVRAGTVTIDFEGITDGTSVGTTYAGQGLTLSSGIVVVSGAFGGSLNEFDFPPISPGQAVFLNEADTTSLFFSQPVLSFAGYFTYGGPLTLNFYDAANVLLTSLTSAFQTNVGTAGDPGSSPNELLAVGTLANARRVDVVAPGTDFTLDNLTFVTTDGGGGGEVPEPATAILWITSGLTAVFVRRLRQR